MHFQSLCPIFPAKSLDEIREFYLAIGFSLQGHWEDYGYMILTRDAAEVHFFEKPDLLPAENPSGGYLRLAEVDALSDHLATLNLAEDDISIPRFGRVTDTPWGMRETAWVDPSGNGIRAGAPIDG